MKLNSEDRWIIISTIMSLAGVALAALLRNPAPIGISVFVILGFLLLAQQKTKSSRIAWLLVFGFVAGFVELLADWIHVRTYQSLVYNDYFGLKIAASPSYMPFGWCITVLQFGYLALRLAELKPAFIAIGIPALLGFLFPPWYEELAAPAGAWKYAPYGITFSHTPLWVILTYGGCMFSVASAAITFYKPFIWSKAILAGFFCGASFLFWSVLWFALLD
jgi:hypothetical protein